MHSVPVPINVRCYSNSDIIVRRSEVSLRAIFRRMHCNKSEAQTFALEDIPPVTRSLVKSVTDPGVEACYRS